MKKTLLMFFIGFLFLNIQSFTFAQEKEMDTVEGKIIKIISEKEINKQLTQKLQIQITSGNKKGIQITIDTGAFQTSNSQKYSVGDELYLNYLKNPEGKETYIIQNFKRSFYLYILFIIFFIFTVIIGKLKGFLSILGMALSFLMIFFSILPNILNGVSPVLAVLMASLFMVPMIFFIAHGINKKTFLAVFSTLITLLIIGVLSYVFIELTKLTGFSSDEASFLQVYKNGAINMKGILLASMIIGALGILDDITISQIAIVEEIANSNNKLGKMELYKKAMKIGQDHIASMVNTLVLVYAGAAFPLFLLFVNNKRPFNEIINMEMVAEEIVRTFVGSIGLILAVPISTYFAVITFCKKNK